MATLNPIANPKPAYDEQGKTTLSANEYWKQLGFNVPEDTDPVLKKTKPVGILSSDNGASQLSKDINYVDTTYPKTTTPQTTQKTTTQDTNKTVDQAIESQKTPQQLALESSLKASNDKVENLVNDYISYNVDNDPDFQAQANSIKSEFDKLRRETEQINYQRQRAFETLGYRTGATQYAGGIQMGIEGEELTQANERMSEITRQENATLSAAKSAFKSQKYDNYFKLVTSLKDIRDQKAQELSNYNSALADYNNKLAQTNKDLLEQQKFAFEVYKFEQQQATAQKPMVVSAGSSIYDPSTGEFLGTAPKPIDNKAPELSTWGGYVHQWNPNTSSWETLGFSKDISVDTETANQAMDWANLISQGKAKITEVPADVRGAVATALSKLPPKKEDVSKAQTKITELNNILQHSGLNSSVGTTFAGRIGLFDKLSGAKQDFIGKVQRLLSEKTLQSLIDAKANGATFGALSEGELRILEAAASTLGTWAVRNADGEVVGYDISQDAFKNEIKRIKSEYENLVKTTAGQTTSVNTLEQAVDDFYLKNPDKRQYIDSLDSSLNPATNQHYTADEKKQIYEAMGIPITFSSSPSMDSKGSVMRIASAIGQYESGGNYKAIGPDTGGGNKALGKYQIMQSNLPSWSREALGRTVGQQEFLNSPAIQDKIAQYKMNQYYQKYGTVEDVASVWFSGRPMNQAGNAKDVIGTSVPTYIKNIKSIYNNLG